MLQRSTTTIFVASVATVGMVGALYFYLSSHVDDNRTPANITSNQENQEKLLLKDRTCPRRSLNVKKDHVVEICLSDLQSVREALSGGCESIELCVNRIEGGVTPSIGLIEQAVTIIGGKDVALHVLIRPRPGGFYYSNDEFDIVQRDILAAKMAGADGIVFGALDSDGKIDIPRMKLVRELSEGMLLTFHRAFDVCSEAHDVALEKIISLRCDRLLTSGGAQSNVVHNLQALAAIQRQAAVRIVVIAAAGVSSDNVQRIIRDTGVRAVHAGSSVTKKISSSSVLEKPFGNKVKISCISVPISPKDSTGESYVDVAVDRVDSDDSRTAELANAHASSAGGVVGATASFSEELLCWNCVSEDLVYALVSEASTAFTTTTNSEDFANIGKDYSTGVVEGSYIHL